jgi:ankyrin repeat protein
MSFAILKHIDNRIIIGLEKTLMSSRRFFNTKKKPAKATTDNTKNTIEESVQASHHTRSKSHMVEDGSSSPSPSSSSTSTQQESDRSFIHNPKDKQRAKKFEQQFGVKYAEGTKTNYPLAIASIYKLAMHHIPHPYGVISTTPIPDGATLAEYTGELMSGEPDDMSYIYRVGKQFIDGRVIGSIGRFFNHSDNNNCRFVTEGGKVLIKTTREIAPGEQLTVNYGHKYFTTDINRVYIDAQHTSLSFQEMFQQQQRSYTPLSKLKDAKLKKTIKELMNCTEEHRILVPSIEKPNYPILLVNDSQIDDDQAEITLFQALCLQQGNNKSIFAAIENGADINVQDSKGRNALFYVISNPNMDDDEKAMTLNQILSEAQNYQYAPFVTDSNFRTVFHYCIENHLNHCLGVILSSVFFNIEHFDLVVESPINTAIRSQNIEALAMLLTKYSYINLQNHLAAEHGQMKLVTCIAGIVNENTLNDIYTVFSSFMNIGQLASQVQAERNQQAENARRTQRTRSHQSSSSSSHSSQQDPSAITEDAVKTYSKRVKKPTARYTSPDYLSNTPSKNVAQKRAHEETPKPPETATSHTVFSRKKQKHTHVKTDEQPKEQASSANKSTRQTRSRH